MRYLPLLILLLCIPAQAQDKCTLNVAPVLRGFSLGQPRAEIEKQFKSEYEGVIAIGGSQSDSLVFPRERFKDADRERFKDILQIEFKFLDGKLVLMEFSYDSSIQWKDELEFVAVIADKLGLPRKGWMGRMPTRLECANFYVEAMPILNKLSVGQLNYKAEIERRKKEAEDKRRRDFSP